MYQLTNMYFIWGKGQYYNAWAPPYYMIYSPSHTPSNTSRPPDQLESQSNVSSSSHSFRKAWFRLAWVHTSMYRVCTSTYSHRSHSHFISNQVSSPLLPSRVSFWRLSDALLQNPAYPKFPRLSGRHWPANAPHRCCCLAFHPPQLCLHIWQRNMNSYSYCTCEG